MNFWVESGSSRHNGARLVRASVSYNMEKVLKLENVMISFKYYSAIDGVQLKITRQFLFRQKTIRLRDLHRNITAAPLLAKKRTKSRTCSPYTSMQYRLPSQLMLPCFMLKEADLNASRLPRFLYLAPELISSKPKIREV